MDRTTHSAFLARQGAVVTVEWHEASAAAGVGGGGGGGENGGWTFYREVRGLLLQSNIRQSVGPNSNGVLPVGGGKRTEAHQPGD